MTKSARLFPPLLAPGQAQKEITHNEALAQLDIITQAVVQAVGVDVPPASPAPGECWIIGPSPEGSWSGMAQHLAGWTENGWRYVQPFIGLGVWTVDEGMFEIGRATSGLQSLMRISYAVFCLKNKNNNH